MIAQNLILIIFIYFLHLPFAESSDLSAVKSQSVKSLKFLNPKIKREVINLEVFDDIKQVKEDDKSDDDVIFVCGNKREVVCICDIDEKRMECEGDAMKTANLKPVAENFVIQNVVLIDSKYFTLEKGKTFPGNEEAITLIRFQDIKMIKFENSIFDTFTNLKTLWFWGTPMSNINENLLTEKLGKVLLNLELFHCNLTEINPMIFQNLKNLEKLELSQNQQMNGRINGKFPKDLNKLKFLDLNLCNLSSLNYDTFEHLRSLEDLYLSRNRFTSIPSTIKFLSNLKTLTFRLNFELKYIESCAFCNLKNLKDVNLNQCNNLTYIDENAFGAISNGFPPKIHKFNIRHCNISVLYENLLDWKNIENINLIGNPFACNCSMAWLFKDLMSNDSIYESKLSRNYYATRHQKFTLGCLGPPPSTLNHTYPYTVVEIFSSCENSSSFFSNILWYFLTFLCFISIFIVLVYANRSRLQNFVPNFF